MTRWLAAAVIGSAALASGCAQQAAFPSLVDNPTPRNETPLNADDVKRVTNELITARDHLSAEAPPQPSDPNSSATQAQANAAPAASAAPVPASAPINIQPAAK